MDNRVGKPEGCSPDDFACEVLFGRLKSEFFYRLGLGRCGILVASEGLAVHRCSCGRYFIRREGIGRSREKCGRCRRLRAPSVLPHDAERGACL